MQSANRPLVHASLATVLVIALTLALTAGQALAQSCPNNFFDVLESKADTTASKQDIGNNCRDREVTVTGALVDIAKQGDVFVLHLASTVSGNRITVTMRDTPGADMSKLQKGSVVTVAAKMRDFVGLQNEYVTLDDGTCRNCP
jgi:hypothetical protein